MSASDSPILDLPAAVGNLTDQAGAMTRHGLSSLLDSTQPLRDQARHARQCTTRYIQDEPFKAVLIAAAAGAVLMALGGLTRRPGRRD